VQDILTVVVSLPQPLKGIRHYHMHLLDIDIAHSGDDFRKVLDDLLTEASYTIRAVSLTGGDLTKLRADESKWAAKNEYRLLVPALMLPQVAHSKMYTPSTSDDDIPF